MTLNLDVEYIKKEYLNGRSIYDISNELGVDKKTIKKRLDRANVHLRGPKEAHMMADFSKGGSRKNNLDIDFIKNEYLKGKSIECIARMLNVCSDTISRRIKEMNIIPDQRNDLDLDYIKAEYLKGRASYDIADELGVSFKTILNRLKEYNIPMRGRADHWKGVKKSKEHREKIAESHRGKPHPHKGHEITNEIKKKIRENRRNTKGFKHSLESRKRMSIARKGYRHTKEARIKMSNAKKGLYNKENHPNWKGGISYEPYCSKFDRFFKFRVRSYWNNECGLCGKKEYENGERLSVHHVNYDKQTCCNITIPLFLATCRSCNAKLNYNRAYWEEVLTNYIMIWHNGQCYLPKS